MQLVPHKKFGQNWPTHESLHKIHLGRAFQPISHHFYGICCYLKLADTIARYKNRNLKPKNRIGRLKNRNSKRTDTIGRYKNRNLRPRNRIGRLKNRNSKRTDTIGRYKNRNLASTDCIVRYNRKIESVSENRSIGPFAHLCSLEVEKSNDVICVRMYIHSQRHCGRTEPPNCNSSGCARCCPGTEAVQGEAELQHIQGTTCRLPG
jgi:hypothetical protein